MSLKKDLPYVFMMREVHYKYPPQMRTDVKYYSFKTRLYKKNI